MTLCIGADPEFALYNTETKKYVSANTFIPGSKVEPHDLGGGVKVHPDGLAVEYAIPPIPLFEKGAGEKIFEANMDAIETIRSILPREIGIVRTPSAWYEKKHYESLPDDVKELGCDPEYDATNGDVIVNASQNYLESINERYVPRTFGGHIHIGWTEHNDVHDPTFDIMGRAVSIILRGYLMNTLLDTDSIFTKAIGCFARGRVPHSINIRGGGCYGSMNSYRTKSYGVEWRAPSNSWVVSLGACHLMVELVEKIFSSNDLVDMINKCSNPSIRVIDSSVLRNYKPSHNKAAEFYYASNGWYLNQNILVMSRKRYMPNHFARLNMPRKMKSVDPLGIMYNKPVFV